MEDMYHKILKKIFKEEDIPGALKEMERFFELRGIDFKYYIYAKSMQREYYNDFGLKSVFDELKEPGKVERDGRLCFKYNFESSQTVISINNDYYRTFCEVEEFLETFVYMIEKVVQIEIFRLHSFISPIFYEVSKVFYTNKDLDVSLEEFYVLMVGILGIRIFKIEKGRRDFFIKAEVKGEQIKELRYKNLIFQYVIDREVDKSIEIEKILNLLIFILNSYLETRIAEERQREFLEYQVASKENLTKLNKLLEKSLYKMTFISNLYKKLSKARDIENAMDTVEKFIKSEVGYNFLEIECQDMEKSYGEFHEELEKEVFEDTLLEGEITYRIKYYKSEITNEDEVYMGLIFNNSKAEIENILLYKKVQELATIDGITGLFIHRHFIQQLEKEMEVSHRYNNKLSLIMFDIDNFKKFNDTYGHVEGDRALADVARVIRESVRKVDVPCRYGGEEFITIVPFTAVESARAVAERIRENIEKNTGVTVSVGVTEYIEGEERDLFIKRADAAMYHAKQNGKNRVTVM